MRKDGATSSRKRCALATLAGFAIPASIALIICSTATVVIATPVEYPNFQAAQGAANQAPNPSDVLEKLIADIVDAVRSKNTLRQQEMIGSLIMSKDTSWFASQFDEKTAGLLRSAYDQAMRDFVSSTRRLYEADILRAPISIHVSSYSDPQTTPQPIRTILQSMKTPNPLYEVSLSGGRPTFQVALSPTGGRGTVVAGDLDGYFIEVTPEGFRYVPASVLMLAVQEQAKGDYEILSRDDQGRPELVRMKPAALAGMIIDRSYPTYPQSARAKHVSGEVVLSVRIGKNGRVREVNVQSGPPELQKAAIDAMKKWRFKLLTVDGSAVEVQTEFVFNLQAGSQ